MKPTFTKRLQRSPETLSSRRLALQNHKLAITAAALVSGAALAQDKGASIKGEKERC